MVEEVIIIYENGALHFIKLLPYTDEYDKFRETWKNNIIKEVTKTRFIEALQGLIQEDEMRPIPEPRYPCKECYEEFSWYPEELFWSEKEDDWICGNCWEKEFHGKTMGCTLAEEIFNQKK